MKQLAKKLCSLLLCAVLLFAMFAVGAGAVSVSEGEAALRRQWKRGEGPSAGGLQPRLQLF